MTKRMLIDATHPEETRVVVVDGNRLDDFDFESASKQQLKGNIYLARVIRVEPSLQAAFVEYGGNRHGFLAFSEIHPDYYRIPIEDREALLAEERARNRDDDDDDDAEDDVRDEETPVEPVDLSGEAAGADAEEATGDESADDEAADGATNDNASGEADGDTADSSGADVTKSGSGGKPRAKPETVGGDAIEEVPRKRRAPNRRYKIQEVVARRQIMLVQVVKEERGNKGAALTTYLSLAGRYCVLMPNTARGGGVSRKITSAGDRKRLKTVVEGLDVPDGMAVIVRTAGSERTKAEIKRDYEYLLRLWDDIRETTMNSTAPCLIHEEGNLIKRSIRDLYTRDLGEVLVDGEEGYKTAKSFMRTLIPSHAKRVQPYRDTHIPLFHRFQVESQLDAIHSPQIELKSGGYIVLNQTEALVAIDVNSGRSTSERNIEETALKTNLEAADEVARQLRLRDLAGLVVIDFIDMEENRNQHAVERRLKEAMKSDRARIQIGRISHFGLLELSRQRLRPSLFETSTTVCPHCKGTGFIRSIESTALHILRAVEEEGLRNRSAEISVKVAAAVALYILNQKRERLAEIEERYGFRVYLESDESLTPPDHKIDKLRPKTGEERRAFQENVTQSGPLPEIEEPDEPEVEDEDDQDESTDDAEDRGGRRKRRRRGGRRRGGDNRDDRRESADNRDTSDSDEEGDESGTQDGAQDARGDRAGDDDDEDGGGRKRRRRGRRGGRRRSRRRDDEQSLQQEDGQQDDGHQEGGQQEGGQESDQHADHERQASEAVAANDAGEVTSEPGESSAPDQADGQPEVAAAASEAAPAAEISGQVTVEATPAEDQPAEDQPAEDQPAELPAAADKAEEKAEEQPAEKPKRRRRTKKQIEADKAAAEAEAAEAAQAEATQAEATQAEATQSEAAGPAEATGAETAPAETAEPVDAPAVAEGKPEGAPQGSVSDMAPAANAPAEDAPAENAPAEEAPAEEITGQTGEDQTIASEPAPSGDTPTEAVEPESHPAIDVQKVDGPAEKPKKGWWRR